MAKGRVYFGGSNGYLYCSTTSGGSWAFSAVSSGAAINSSPAVADGMLYVGSRDYLLYAYSLDAGPEAAGKRLSVQAPPDPRQLVPNYRLRLEP